jgi:hypothetical protein
VNIKQTAGKTGWESALCVSVMQCHLETQRTYSQMVTAACVSSRLYSNGLEWTPLHDPYNGLMNWSFLRTISNSHPAVCNRQSPRDEECCSGHVIHHWHEASSVRLRCHEYFFWRMCFVTFTQSWYLTRTKEMTNESNRTAESQWKILSVKIMFN